MSPAFVENTLLMTGAITASVGVMALAPRFALKISFGLNVGDNAVTLFLARLCGILVFGVGILLVLSAWRPESRDLILGLAVWEKSLVVLMLGLGLARRRFGRQVLPTLIFDATCVGLYLAIFAAGHVALVA